MDSELPARDVFVLLGSCEIMKATLITGFEFKLSCQNDREPPVLLLHFEVARGVRASGAPYLVFVCPKCKEVHEVQL